MTLDRRTVLVALAAGAATARVLPFAPAPAAAGTLAAGSSDAATKLPLRRADGTVDWRAVRAEFDGLAPDWTHLASFLFVSHPRTVRVAIESYRALLDSDPYWIEEAMYEGRHGRPYDAARQALAEFLGGAPEEIALTSNTTSALAAFYHGLRIRPDQEIVTTEHDHFVHHTAIDYSCARSGASSRRVALYDQPSRANAGEIVRRVERALGPKTRALGVTWVHSSTGVKLPIAEIAEVVARANRGRAEADRCLLLVDGVHGFANQDVDAAKTGVDFFAAGAHKWFFGPRGTGFLWGKKELWQHLRPSVPSFDPDSMEVFTAWAERRAERDVRAGSVAPGGFLAYEHFFALPAAAELHRAIGRTAIAARIAELNIQVRAGLAKIPGLTLHTPRDPALAAGINCFEIAGLAVNEVVHRLVGKRIRATASPYAVSYARFAAGIMNQPGEIEAALATLHDVSRA